MPPLVIAHRGNSSERPENTLAAFASALELGAPMVELDVHLTRDGEVVVIHDDTLDRTTSGTGAVAERSLVEIRGLSAGYAQRFGQAFVAESVPTLVEVLDLLRGRAGVLIEIKKAPAETGNDRLERATIAALRSARFDQDAAIISFDRATLAACRELESSVPRGLLAHSGEPASLVAAARALDCALLMPEKGLLGDELGPLCARAGLKLATWVVDDPADLDALAHLDLAGVGSNRPGLLLAHLAERAAGPLRRS
jgi:glycerophosphoryl diester phosphodiesterase